MDKRTIDLCSKISAGQKGVIFPYPVLCNRVLAAAIDVSKIEIERDRVKFGKRDGSLKLFEDSLSKARFRLKIATEELIEKIDGRIA